MLGVPSMISEMGRIDKYQRQIRPAHLCKVEELKIEAS